MAMADGAEDGFAVLAGKGSVSFSGLIWYAMAATALRLSNQNRDGGLHEQSITRRAGSGGRGLHGASG